MEFYLWGYLKGNACQSSPASLADILRTTIVGDQQDSNGYSTVQRGRPGGAQPRWLNEKEATLRMHSHEWWAWFRMLKLRVNKFAKCALWFDAYFYKLHRKLTELCTKPMCHIYLRHLVVNTLKKRTPLGIEPGTVIVFPVKRCNFTYLFGVLKRLLSKTPLFVLTLLRYRYWIQDFAFYWSFGWYNIDGLFTLQEYRNSFYRK